MADSLTAFLVIADTVQKLVQQLGERYYKESRDWEAFPRKVEKIRRESNVWVEALRNAGILDQDIIDALKEATLLLEEHKRILANRLQPRSFIYACGIRCSSKMHGFLFPNECQDNMRDVEEAFESIPRLLKSKEEAKCAAEREMLNRPLSMVFCKDARYVPLETTEREIDFALRSSIDSVVLLHGGPGQGKSTLAQQMALHYESIKLFENVIFLECGPKVNTSMKQLDLLKNLGITVTGDKKEPSEDKPTSDPQMLHVLKNAQKIRKILIILDDIWEGGFLHDMINLCGDNVKLLVTSQLGALCNQLKCSFRAIEIQKCSDEVAKRILFSHVRFPKEHIPNQQILEVVGEIIKDTGGNPLALASVASAIPQGRKNSLSEWEEASLTLTQLLRHKIHDSYPRSFWSAMQLAIERLSKDSQNLYVLVHLCKGPSVPEEVIRYFFSKITLSRPQVTFQTLANELEERQLLKITIASVDSHHEERSWSTHSLQKKFMEDDEDMRRKKEILSEDIKTSPKSCQGEDALVRDALCVLYCEDQFTKKVAAQLKVPVERFNDLRRKAFEPITRLLGRNATHPAASTAQTVAKQVFVQYFYKAKRVREFDDDNLSVLLNMRDYPWAQYATLAAIGDIFVSLEMSLKQDSKLLSTLQTFLLDNENPSLQEKAAKCLSTLASISVFNEVHILEKERVLVGLVSALRDDRNPGLQNAAATALSNLSYLEGSVLKILRTEGALPGLVNALSKDDNQELQQAAAVTMMYLACGPKSCKLQIMEAEGAIPKFIEFLYNDGNAELQKIAARALGDLAVGGNEIKLYILKHEEVFAALVRCLSKDDNWDVQKAAGATIGYLFDGSKSFHLQIVGVVAARVESLGNYGNVAEQVNAAATLSSLADEVDAIRFCILKQEGALAALVTSLSIDENPRLQYYAASAMANLAKGPDSCKLAIVEGYGAVAALLKSISSDQNPKLREEAARALGNLARGGDTIKQSIMEHEGALAALVRCLWNDLNRKLEESAALAIHTLSTGPQSIRLAIVREEGAVGGLVKSSLNEGSRLIRHFALEALKNLAAGGEEIKTRMLEENLEFADVLKSIF